MMYRKIHTSAVQA